MVYMQENCISDNFKVSRIKLEFQVFYVKLVIFVDDFQDLSCFS